MSYTKHDFESGGKLYAYQLNEMDTQIAQNETETSGKIGYAEVSDGVLYLYDNSTDKTLIKSLVLPSGGGTGGGLTEAQVKALIEDYGYITATSSVITNKVDKVDGKVLSSNDFLDAEKEKVDAIPADAKYTDTIYTISKSTDGKSLILTPSDGEIQTVDFPSVPTLLSELSDDATHRLVTDAEKTTWNNNTSSASGLTISQIDSLCDILTEAIYGSIQTENIESLRSSLKSGGGSVTVSSISATYTGGEVTSGTSTSALTGLTVKATYSNGSTSNVTGYTLSPSTISTGTNIITVTYSGLTTTFTVTGKEAATLTSISAEYTGGSIDEGTAVSALSGLTVTGHYSDNTSSVIESGYEFAPSTVSLGENTITVSYGELTTTFTVTGVAPRELSTISVTYSGGKVNADTTKQTDLTGIVVTANYTDGTSTQVTGYTISPTDGFSSGENTVYVTYGGKTATFTVTAYKLESISAVANTTEYTIGTNASDLDLTVTAMYDDSTSEVVTGWTATGTVAEGENTFTIEYGGKSTTVTVTGAGSSVADLEIVPSASGFHSSGATLDDSGAYAAGTASGTDTDCLVYALPSKVDITPYSKMVVSLSTSATAAIDGSSIWFYSDASSYKTGTPISNCAGQTVEIGGSTEFAIPDGAVAMKMNTKRYTNYPYLTIVCKA